MVKKLEMRMGDSPEEGSDTIVARWTFFCGACKQKRMAVIFGSGHIFDIVDGQQLTKESLIIEGGTAKNLYLIPEAGMEEFRESLEGMQSIKNTVGQGHADRFHGGSSRVRVIGKN